MKRFIVSLTKSYAVEIDAKDQDSAKELAEYYTSDIQDISTEEERKKHNFRIGNIECTYNEAVSVYDEEEDCLYDDFDN